MFEESLQSLVLRVMELNKLLPFSFELSNSSLQSSDLVIKAGVRLLVLKRFEMSPEIILELLVLLDALLGCFKIWPGKVVIPFNGSSGNLLDIPPIWVLDEEAQVDKSLSW